MAKKKGPMEVRNTSIGPLWVHEPFLPQRDGDVGGRLLLAQFRVAVREELVAGSGEFFDRLLYQRVG